jgi:hypothetical protein
VDGSKKVSLTFFIDVCTLQSSERMVFGLFKAFLHFIFEKVFWSNKTEFVDKLNKMLTGHPLTIVVHHSFTKDFEGFISLFELDWTTIFAKNIELYEFKPIEVLFLDVLELQIWIHIITLILKRI